MYDKQSIMSAKAEHGTIFFDCNLLPVVPKFGQWFCEIESVDSDDYDDMVSPEALVEYRGASQSGHRVLPEYSDCDRAPRGLALIRQ